jgi:replicative DNA helicase
MQILQSRFTNESAERAILGTAIMNNKALLRVADFLEEKHFYFEEHKTIWLRFIELGRSDKLANEVTMKEFFENNEHLKSVGGAGYLSVLFSEASGIIDIREYGQVLVELWQKRELEALLNHSLVELENSDFSAISANIENELTGLQIQEPKKKTQHISEMIADVEYEESVGLSSKFVPTGFRQLDDILNGGIYNQQLCIIGARPSVGKTAICQNIILSASKYGKKCLFISLEVDKRNVLFKFLSLTRSIETWKIQKNILSQSERADLMEAKKELKEFGLYVNDSSYLKISQIKQIVKSQLEKNPVDLVVVDYVQIIKGDETKWKNESLIIKENTTMLKAIAKQYDVAVLALAQINRKGVEGNNQEPNINDFKGSGGIEEDADVAIILHRDRSEEKKDGYFSKEGKLIVAKNRHGRTGEVGIQFDGRFGRFTELGGF